MERVKLTAFAERVENLLSLMTLEEKVGQITMAENNSIAPEEVAECCIGAVLSGGGGNPTPNSPSHWRGMVCGFQRAALNTRLGIPLIYGVDAVHGHNNVRGAVIFPHNIALGATADADLVERIGRVTKRELLATGVQWTFAPSVSVPHDIRWGRTYEGYGEDAVLVGALGAALVRGLQGLPADAHRVLACAKHYLADGAAEWRAQQVEVLQGSTAPAQDTAPNPSVDGSLGQWQLDQGAADIDEGTLRAIHLPPYQAAIAAGVGSVMASYGSWDGQKMHAHRYLLTDVLKGELGFSGLVVSDWMAINHIDPDYYTCVVSAVNAGIDMVMVPYDFRLFIETLLQAVTAGDVPLERVDDAVRRILRVKIAFGLLEEPFGVGGLLGSVGCEDHRNLAREAVRRSLVLLKNEGETLPLPKDAAALIVAGEAADDIGLQCGGWSISWQGEAGATTEGATILDGIRRAASGISIDYAADGDFGADARAHYGIVVLHEEPYAEGFGDRRDLSLSAADCALVERLRAHCEKLIVVLIAGRPRIVRPIVPLADALVMAWLPGSEGDGVADVLFGDYPFRGRLPFSWPRSMEQVPQAALRASGEPPLWEAGAGIAT